MQFVAPEAKRGRCPAPQTAGQRRGWRRAELGFFRTAVEFDDPRLFLGPERIRGFWARTTRIGEQKR